MHQEFWQRVNRSALSGRLFLCVARGPYGSCWGSGKWSVGAARQPDSFCGDQSDRIADATENENPMYDDRFVEGYNEYCRTPRHGVKWGAYLLAAIQTTVWGNSDD